MFIVTTFSTFGASLWATFWILDKADAAPSEIVGWVILGSCLLVGLVVGYCFVKHQSLGLGLLAALGGISLGFIVNVALFIKEDWQYYCILAGCAIIAGVTTYYLQKDVVIWITSFVGSYAIIRGISMYTGGFPSEMELHDDIKAGTIDWDDFPKIFYAFLGGIVILTIGSAIFQFKRYKANEDTFGEQKMRRR